MFKSPSHSILHSIVFYSIGCIFVHVYTDRTIKIYNVSESAYEITATLQGHEGPVWQVSWAHPKYGVLLASCSFDGSVLIHREQRPGEWTVLHAARNLHDSSVNGVAFAPQELGLMVAAASSDGRVSVLQHQSNHTWSVEYLPDCQTGVNAVSWAPHGAYYDTKNPEAPEAPRLVTAGCDNQIRFWVYSHEQGQWTLESTTANSKQELAHSDWVRDVAWSPCLLPNQNIVASCSEDRTVIIWKQDRSEGDTAEWKPTLLHTFEDPVWRVSWSVTGHLLAVSSGDSNVSLWKAGLNGKWTQVEMTEDDPAAMPQQ
jgi:protein transport protein SEC13